MTFTAAGPDAATTPRMSSSTAFQSPDLAAPTLMTMSISPAPDRTASRASSALDSGAFAPRGKPTTVQTAIPLPASFRRQKRTQ